MHMRQEAIAFGCGLGNGFYHIYTPEGSMVLLIYIWLWSVVGRRSNNMGWSF